MNVLHGVYNWLSLTASWIHTQVRHLPGDVTSHVVCKTTERLDEWGFPRVHRVPRWRWDLDQLLHRAGLRSQLGYLARRIEAVDADLLHSHFGDMAWANHRTAARRDLPHVATVYGFDVSKLPDEDPVWRDRYADLFAHVEVVLCEGPHMGEQVADLGCPREKIRVHHLGIDTADVDFEPRSWIPGEPLRVLMAATFTEKKGIPDGIRALAEVADDVDVRLTLIGDAGQKEEKDRILDTLRSTGMADRTRLPGYVPHERLLEEARDHHLFLQPSRHARDGDNEGGAPVTLIEVVATGMPVVATRHCDIPEVVPEGVGGHLAREADVEDLAAAIRDLLEDPGSWEDLARRGRRRIEEEFDARKQGRRLAGIYREVVGGDAATEG